MAMCQSEAQRARNASSDVRAEQRKALDQYYLLPNGKERAEGFYSTIQTSETRNAIEQMLPIVVDMFLQPESPIVFRPRAANDLQQALQETTLVNNEIYVENNGAMLFTRWFKEALLLKNGYVKVFWDEKTDDRIEKYKGLSQEEYQKTLAELDERDEVIKESVNINELTGEVTYDCEIRVVNGDPQVRIVNCPSDRILVAREHGDVSLQGASWCCHWELRSKSDLVVDGYNKKLVQDIPAATREDLEGLNFKYSSNMENTDNTSADWSRDMVIVYEHYIRADRNGDGEAELLQVVIGGSMSGGVVLDVQEVDFVPIIAITPFVLPHSHYGLALADFTRPYQDANTHLMRQVLDNINLTNNPMMYVNTTAVKNPEALAKARLGGVLLGTTDGMPVQPISVPFMAAQSFGVLQELQTQFERATGLTDAATGMNSEVLAQSTNLVGAMTLNQAQMRARMIATMFAETGVKELVLRVRELLMKHMEREKMVEVTGQFVSVNPRSWIRNRAASVRIGIGTVHRSERVGVLQNIIALQEKIFAAQGTLDGPLLTHQNVYNSLAEVSALTGAQGSDRYFSDPTAYLQRMAAQEPEQQPIDTALELEAAKTAITAQKNAAEHEIKLQELELKRQELELKRAELNMRGLLGNA